MDKKWLIVGLCFLILIVATVIYLLLIQKAELSPAQKILEDCNVLEYSEQGKINIVIFADKENAEKYMNFFFEISPFDENKEAFNFFYIDDYEPECEIYQEKAILCYNEQVIKKASSCPNDYIAVIKPETSSIRSSAYMNVMSLNSKHPLVVFLHEFGHVFANFAEEYVPAPLLRGAKNCVSDCEKFEYDTDGCFEGCSKEEYYRSIENGIMRTLTSKNYGIFNERIILDKINSEIDKKGLLSGFAVKEQVNCEDERYYLIKGSYDGGEIFIKCTTIEIGCVGNNGVGDLSYELVLEDGSVFESGEFNPQVIFTDVQREEQIDGEVFESDEEFYLKIPFIEEGKKVKILEEDKVIAEIELQRIYETVGSRPCKK